MHKPLVRSLFLLLGISTLIVVGHGAFAPASGADCGTGVAPCRCGDTVVSDTVLSRNDPVLKVRCPCDGLVVAATVKKIVVSGSIKGSGVCTGIRIEPGVSDAIVTQGYIRDFSIGIDARAGVTHSQFTRLRILRNLESGILLAGDDNLVEANQVQESLIFRAIAVSGDGNVVRLNRTEDSDRIAVEGAGNTVSRNMTVRGPGGIDISGENAVVDSNRVTDGAGFKVEGTGHLVTRNYSARNLIPGFEVFGTRHSFTHNKATDNLFDGFSVFATESTFTGNVSSFNRTLGIRDPTTGGGTSGTANSYTNDNCIGNGVGNSDPSGLCS